MEIGEFLILVVCPIGVGAFAVSVSQVRRSLFWAIALSTVAALIGLSLLLRPTAIFTGPRQESIAAFVFFALPTLAAFTTARRGPFRKRRSLALVGATVVYLLTLLATLVGAVNLGFLQP